MSYYCPVTKTRSSEPCSCTKSQKIHALAAGMLRGSTKSTVTPITRGMFLKVIKG